MSDREKHGLRGPAASVRTEHFDCDEQAGEVAARPRFSEVFTYDRDGRTTSSTHESPGTPVSTTNYTYNHRGDLAKTTYEWEGQPGGDTVYHYDEAGRLLRVTQNNTDGTERERSRFTYHPGGGKTEVRFGATPSEMAELRSATKTSTVDSEVGFVAVLAPTTTIHFDADGRPLEELAHDENHVLIHKEICTYDDKGLLLEKRRESGHKSPSSFSPDDPSLGPQEREVLEKVVGRLFQPGASIERTTYTYDGLGRAIEEVTEELSPFGGSRSTTEYDDHDNPILVRSVHESQEFQATSEGELVNPTSPKQTVSTNIYRYTYDKHGNWTEKVYLYIDPATGQPKQMMIERRTISYW